MFSNQGGDQGCGKWLTTKNTRRIAQSLKQKNARGTKKGRKKQPVIKDDHLPGVVISSTPMSPRLVEMLSRVKQAKVERFFKPVGPKDQVAKSWFGSGELSRDNNGGLGREDKLQSYITPILRRQHKKTTDQEELQVWEDDDTTSNDRLQNETDKLSISGVLPIEASKPCSFANDLLAQDLHHPSTTVSKQHEPLINSSPDDAVKSPVSKRFRSITEDSPTCPSSPPNSFNYDDDEKDTDSFQYTQWVNEQKRKSKELQSDSPLSSRRGKKLESSGRSSSSGSTDLDRKHSPGICDENFSDTESQFCFSQWALEQKAKCKRLQNDSYDELSLLSDPRDKTDRLQKNPKDSKSPNYFQSDLDCTESNFQYTEWVREQKTKSKEIQYSAPQSKKVPQTFNGIMNESLNENDGCIPESEVFEGIKSECEYGWQYKMKGFLEEELSKTDHLRCNNMNLLSRKALLDVSNAGMCSNGTSSRIVTKNLNELCQRDTKNEESNSMTSPFQESEYFRYTEWTRNQRQICKQIQKEPEVPSIQDKFWDVPTEKKKLVLASDTDQESDSEFI